MSQLNFRLPTSADASGSGLTSGLDLTVEVRKANLTLLACTTASQSVDIARAGLYLASARLPEGGELSGSVRITDAAIQSGQAVTLDLAPDPDAAPSESAAVTSRRDAFDATDGGGSGGEDDAADGGSGIEGDDGGYVFYDPDGGRNSARGFLEGLETRYEMPPEGGVWVPTTPKTPARPESQEAPPERPALLRAFSGGKWNRFEELADDWGAIAPLAQGTAQVRRLNPAVRLVQLLQADKRPINVAVPCGECDACWLEVSREANGEAALTVHLENAAADALLRYRANGFVRQAETVSQTDALNAEALLSGKQSAPISAAVGAYALLRSGDMTRLHDAWTQNLRDWFDWLPDGSAIRGEHLARLGQHEKALDCFLDLETRGLPFFSSGLSYAIDRLRLYSSVRNASFDSGKLAQAGLLMAKLCAYSGYVAFDNLLLTFIGLDPNHPDDAKLHQDLHGFQGIDVAAYL